MKEENPFAGIENFIDKLDVLGQMLLAILKPEEIKQYETFTKMLIDITGKKTKGVNFEPALAAGCLWLSSGLRVLLAYASGGLDDFLKMAKDEKVIDFSKIKGLDPEIVKKFPALVDELRRNGTYEEPIDGLMYVDNTKGEEKIKMSFTFSPKVKKKEDKNVEDKGEDKLEGGDKS